jgi:hypothetical protein
MTPEQIARRRESKRKQSKKYREQHRMAVLMYDQLVNLMKRDEGVNTSERRMRLYKEQFGDLAEVAEANYKLKKEMRDGKRKKESSN